MSRLVSARPSLRGDGGAALLYLCRGHHYPGPSHCRASHCFRKNGSLTKEKNMPPWKIHKKIIEKLGTEMKHTDIIATFTLVPLILVAPHCHRKCGYSLTINLY